MKKFKLVSKAVCAVMLAAAFLLPAGGCKKYGSTKHPVIIMVPGLLASGLVENTVDEETGETVQKPIWDPFDSDWTLLDFFDEKKKNKMIAGLMPEAFELLPGILNNESDSILHRLTLDEDGVNRNKNVVPADFDSYEGPQRYGAFQSFKTAYDAIYERYGGEAEIKIVNCDWRADNRRNAEFLENYINGRKYRKIVLIGHSMGNITIANYLARSPKNRKKVVANVSLAGPYYGSLKALSVLDGFEEMMSDFIKELPVLKNILDTQLRAFAMNMPSLPQLLPTIDLLKTEQYVPGASFLDVDGKQITTEEDLLDFYRSRPWAKRASDGEVKKFVADLKEYWDGFYVTTKNGERVHSTALVPTYYIAGKGIATETHISINDAKKDSGDRLSSEYTKEGDGTVPLYSATLGRDAEDFDESKEVKGHTYVSILEGADHFDCGVYFNGELKEKVFAYLDAVYKIKKDAGAF